MLVKCVNNHVWWNVCVCESHSVPKSFCFMLSCGFLLLLPTRGRNNSVRFLSFLAYVPLCVSHTLFQRAFVSCFHDDSRCCHKQAGGSREFTVLLPTKTAVNTPWSRLRRQSVYLQVSWSDEILFGLVSFWFSCSQAVWFPSFRLIRSLHQDVSTVLQYDSLFQIDFNLVEPTPFSWFCTVKTLDQV